MNINDTVEKVIPVDSIIIVGGGKDIKC